MQGRGDFSAIPMLDVSGLRSGDADATRHATDSLLGYLETVGFVYVAGHGIPEDSVQAVREMSRSFFALPEAEKLKVRIDHNFRGYLPIASSTIVTSSVSTVSKPNQSESLMLMHEVAADDPDAIAGKPLQGPNQWPDEGLVPGFRATVEDYVGRMDALGRMLASAISVSLGLASDDLRRLRVSGMLRAGFSRRSPRKRPRLLLRTRGIPTAGSARTARHWPSRRARTCPPT